MRILLNNFNNQIKLQKQIATVSMRTNGLLEDVFQKSNLTFTGTSSLDEKHKKNVQDWQEFCEKLGKTKQERNDHLRTVLSVSNNRKKDFTAGGKFAKNIDEYFAIGEEGSGFEGMMSALLKSSNITNLTAYYNAFSSFCYYQDAGNLFLDNLEDAFLACGILKSYDDMSQFPYFVHHIYFHELDKENPEFEKLNTYIDFMKSCSMHTGDYFDYRFQTLKQRFNNFDTYGDKIDALDYMMSVKDDKFEKLQDVINNHTFLNGKKPTAQELYLNIGYVVDYFYEKNNGESLDGLDEVINIACSRNNLKENVKRSFDAFFNNFTEHQDDISFYQMVSKAGLTASEINEYVRGRHLADVSLIDRIQMRQPILEKISFISDMPYQSICQIYKSFSPILAAPLDKNDSFENLDLFLKIISKYKIANFDSFCDFYKKCTKDKSKILNSNQIREFIEAFQFVPETKNVLTDIKGKNILPINYIKSFEEKFEQSKEVISSSLEKINSKYFIGLSALDVFKRYYDVFEKNGVSVETIQSIVNLESKTSEDYLKRIETTKPFEQYFNSKNEVLEFFFENNLKFDDSKESSQNRDVCLKLIQALKEADSDNFSENLLKVNENGFFKNSKTSLNKISQYDSQLPKILKIVRDKNIQNPEKLLEFFDSYSVKSKIDNLLEHLEKIPEDMDIQEYLDILSGCQEIIKKYSSLRGITNNNISKVNVEKYRNFDFKSGNAINSILCDFVSSPIKANYISFLPDSTTNAKKEFDKYRIASEIATCLHKGGESYRNIKTLFGLPTSKSNEYGADSYEVNAIKKLLPDEFVNLVNSNDWVIEIGDKKVNLTLHSRLRLIDRFALSPDRKFEKLYSPETIEYLKEILETIYLKEPKTISQVTNGNIAVEVEYNGEIIRTIFNKQGKMITSYFKDKY